MLAIPEAEGFDLAAWLVPGVAILVAGGGDLRRAAAVAARRPRSRGVRRPEALDEEDAQRLDADLARYDL